MNYLVRLNVLMCLGLFVTLAGCSGPDLMKEVKAANETNVAKVRSCYILYKSRNKYRAPKNKEELMKFLTEDTSITRNLERMGIEPSESMFISERDQQEVKIRWGVNGEFTPPIVFEASGVDGKYLVAGDDLKEVDKGEYDLLWKGKGEVDRPSDFREDENN